MSNLTCCREKHGCVVVASRRSWDVGKGLAGSQFTACQLFGVFNRERHLCSLLNPGQRCGPGVWEVTPCNQTTTMTRRHGSPVPAGVTVNVTFNAARSAPFRLPQGALQPSRLVYLCNSPVKRRSRP